MMRSCFTWGVVLQTIGAQAHAREEVQCGDDECDTSSLLQRSHKEESRDVQLDARGADTQMDAPIQLVHEVYTYGAPATHKTPFRNGASADGCFAGLRTFTEDKTGVHGEIRLVDAASIFIPYPHAYTNSLVLRSGTDSIYTPCDGDESGHPNWPNRQGSVIDSWGLHHEDSYVGWLENVSVGGKVVVDQEPFSSARLFSRLAFRSYDTFEDQKTAIAMHMPGWTLVHRADEKYLTDIDPVILLQEAASLDCAIVFTGTNDPSEYATSTSLHGVDFCGFQGVHYGYQKELRNLNWNLWPSMRPKLEMCKRVICVGHSLGGALCEVFAACANSGNVSNADYQGLEWSPREPELMEAATAVDEPWRRRL